MYKRRCIVTGSRGAIGSYLCQFLKSKNYLVHEMDLKCPDVNHDIRDPKAVNSIFDAFSPQWVFHLAALADIVPSIENPVDYHSTNVTGTLNLLEASRKYGVERFIYAASSSCYGKNPQTPTHETEEVDPQYPYAMTKIMGEKYVLYYAKVFGLGAVSLRLFNVYSDRARGDGPYGSVLKVFLAQLANGAPLTIVGDGNQMRDFIFVTDVCEAMLRAAESNVTDETFNIGSAQPRTVNRLVELLGSPPVIHVPDRPGEPRITYADIWRAENILGWAPKVTLEEGISRVLKNLDIHKDAPVWTEEKINDATKVWFQCLK